MPRKIGYGKCTEMCTCIRGRRITEAWKFIKYTTIDRREKMLNPTISRKQWIDHYRKLLMEKKF